MSPEAQRAGRRMRGRHPEDLASWKETAAIRADADLLAEVRRGLAALKRRKARVYTLDEVFAD